ncbi:GT-D fold domain-containing glycosyltransferase [Facklamia miroungae]|uniref:Glycosyltransferase, SP_1767 family n=1 Tax=Facklamia miroungae TaxID=120956 RepID=A0A1G7PI15_9LACT|nr:GT-D fold domain-containing glycosyltransferase [Facklamia miroungae]NKZ28719.1 DUF1792 domain-containing protein [Facklamia miroungae]SDF85946.1 glycosyltransferase, SP_1767 family [Facklamia miroungae]
MSVINIKTKLQKSKIGKIIIKIYHYGYAVPVSKFYLLRYFLLKNNKIFRELKKNKFYSDDDVFMALGELNKSLCRFGDGEITWICQNSKGYFGQENSELLSKRLKEIITSSHKDVLIGIPNFFDEMKGYSKVRQNARNVHLSKYAKKWMELTSRENTKYADSLITRVYFGRKNVNHEKMFSKWKKIWESREVIIIEGSATLFGVGNDLLEKASSVQRIIAPAENAFSEYENILKAARKFPKNTLFLIALGPTATVLAYDLALLGFQAIDIGHLDVEYEWFRSGKELNKQIPVKGKYVNEAGGMPNDTLDSKTMSKYFNEIIAII